MTTITIPAPNLSGVLNLIKTEPAVIMMGVNAGVALGVSWGLHLSTDQMGAVTIIATAVLSIITALLARPVSTPVIKGAVTSVLIALGAFHLHLAPSAIGTTVTALSIVLGLLFRQNLTPVASTTGTVPAPATVVVDPVTGGVV
jgi:hypothetical protein